MPQSNSRYNLNKLNLNPPPYFLFFLLSLVFVAISLLAYNYALSMLSTQMTIYNTNNLKPTPDLTPINQPTLSPSITPASDLTPSPSDELTPTPQQPYLKTFQDTDSSFKVDYWSTRIPFQDNSASSSRFVFVNPDGNFVVHVGKADWVWVHSGRQLTTKYTLLTKPTFVFETTSQQIIDLNSPSGLFFTLQCVHNGSSDLKKECDQFVKSFSFLN